MAFSLASIQKAKKRRTAAAPSLPPLGSYDPSVLLQYQQNKRTADNAQQQFDLGQSQAQDNLAIQLARLGQQETNLGTDRGTALENIGRNYGNLAETQAAGANRANVQSAGLLAQSLAKRQANQGLEQKTVDTSYQRSLADSANQKADLSLALSRAYGSGKGGQPLGTNTLNLTQTKADALGGNLDLSGVAYQQAAANGFRFPKKKRSLIV